MGSQNGRKPVLDALRDGFRPIMQSNQTVTTKKGSRYSFRRISIAGLILALFGAGTLMFSKTAHAGLVSFLSSIIGNQEVSAKLKEPRTAESQISPVIVLQAANAIQLALASEAAPVAADNALSPEIAQMNSAPSEPVNTQISLYTVRPGDSVSTVAKMFSVSVNTILWANDLTSKSALQVGKQLVILPVTGITHTVRSGDTIQSIAKKYKADVDEIMNFNDLSAGSALKVGDQIIIPDAEVSVPSSSSAGKSRVIPGYSGPSYAGYYACPAPGARVSQKLHGHNGVDLAAPFGTPLYAAAGGTVIINRDNGAWNGGYGNFIVILHANGTQSLYSHLKGAVVASGATVSKGQLVGYIGISGLTTGPHVHFEIRGAKNPFEDPSLCR